MSFTDIYEFELFDEYGVSGWAAVITANMEKLDDFLHTYIVGTAGEALSKGEAVYLKSDGKFWKAKADADATMPSMGLVVNDADAAGEVVVQRVGPFSETGWSWSAGDRLYVSEPTAGAMTATKPSSRAQPMGIAIDSDTVILMVTLIAI